MEENNNNEMNLNEEQLQQVAGGGGYADYKTYVQLVKKVWAAAMNHGYKTACCPACGVKLELLPERATNDYATRDANNGILWCYSCGAKRKAEEWVINSYNR